MLNSEYEPAWYRERSGRSRVVQERVAGVCACMPSLKDPKVRMEHTCRARLIGPQPEPEHEDS